MELAVSAQCYYARGAGGEQADTGTGALRFQLAISDGYRLLFGCACFRNVVGTQSDKVAENILAHAGAHASGDDRDFVHAGFGICDALFGIGCSAGLGVHTHRMALPIFWDVSWMAGRGFDRQRYFVQRTVWKFAAHHVTTIED